MEDFVCVTSEHGPCAAHDAPHAQLQGGFEDRQLQGTCVFLNDKNNEEYDCMVGYMDRIGEVALFQACCWR